MTIELTLKDAYRATDVHRWQIVKTQRQQSVAEHSFQVALIASRLCDLLEMSEEIRCRVVWYSLIHDLPEVLTGDLSTPLKRMLGDEAMNKLKAFEDTITVAGRPIALGQGKTPEVIRLVVKVADLIEAVAFLDQNATTDHGRNIIHRILGVIAAQDMPAVQQVLEEVLYGKETHLDDVMCDYMGCST
jgi:5'-deoxynucleotidase YfbR-like HD superfamily hydrolase